MTGSEGVAQVRRARAALDIGRPRQALDIAAGVLAAEPDDADAHVITARAHAQLGAWGPQLEAADAALAIRPADYEAHFTRACALQALDRRDEALAAFRSAIEIVPDHWAAHSHLGLLLSERRATRREAWAAAVTGVELAPGMPTAHTVLGHVAIARDDLGAAEEALRRALHLDPHDADALNALSVVLARTGRHREAAGGFGATLALDPQQVEARRNLDWITTKMIQRLHFSLCLGLALALIAASVGFQGRFIAAGIGVFIVAGTLWSAWRNLRGLSAGVISYMTAFPRRQPLRAAWGLCCLAALAALVGCVVLPVPEAIVGVGAGYGALVLGSLLSWVAFGADRRDR